MNDEIERYLDSLRRRLFWMDHRRRRDIMKEVRSHLSERIDQGVDINEAIASFGPAGAVAREYLRVYGFGNTFIAALMMFGALLAFFTVPSLYQRTEELLEVTWTTFGFLSAAIILIIISSLKGGRKAGIAIGAAECAVRFAVLTALAIEGNLTFSDDYVGASGFIISSLFLPLIGYLAWSFRLPRKSAEI